ncbi:MAG: histidine phosphatase family protein [Burkholderiaceae bacterium]
MTELFLVRHGETDWNLQLRFQGQVDPPLNATGHEQARRIARRLASEHADHLYSSDLLRTRQTAEPISAHFLGLPVEKNLFASHDEAGLREQSFGVVDGMRVDDIKLQHPQAWAQWLLFHEDYAMPSGESTRRFHERVMEAVRRIAAAHTGESLVVVTHGGVLDMIYRTARGLPLSGPRQCEIPNAAFNRVKMTDEAIEIIDWADTRHLADLPPQPVYDQSALVTPASPSEA